MKKIFALLVVVVFLSAPLAFSQEEAPAPKSSDNPSAAKPTVKKIQNTAQPKGTGEELVDLDMNRSMNRLEDLERRVSSLERGSRYTDDRIRSIDRDVDDMKRRMRGI